MLVVLDELGVHKALLKIYHDGPTAGHPGRAKTVLGLAHDYWWPTMRRFVDKYVEGCAICQANKVVTTPNQLPLYPITPEDSATPFSMVSMDFIVKLPVSHGYDSILTVTDHDCTKGVIVLPCKEEMEAEGLAKLYKDQIFPFVGLLSKIISDQDKLLNSRFIKELCSQLKVKQNISTTYHPQMDRQSE